MPSIWRCSCFSLLLIGTMSSAFAQTMQGSPSTILAKQGDVVLTLSEVDAFAKTIPEKDRNGFFDSPKRLEALISGLLLKKQLAAEARAMGLENDPAAKLQIDMAVDDALSKARMQRFRDELKIPDLTQLAQEEYLGHKEKYIIEGKLDVKHVLISTKKHSKEEAKVLAETVAKEAREHPDQFDALIDKYSEDESKATNHGLVTEAGSSQLVPAFASASKALKKVGDISPIVQTSFGFHVIQLAQRTPDRQQTFAEVREQILKRLRSEYIEKQVADHTDQLRNKAVDGNADLLSSLRTRYSQSGDQAQSGTPAPSGQP